MAAENHRLSSSRHKETATYRSRACQLVIADIPGGPECRFDLPMVVKQPTLLRRDFFEKGRRTAVYRLRLRVGFADAAERLAKIVLHPRQLVRKPSAGTHRLDGAMACLACLRRERRVRQVSEHGRHFVVQHE